HAAAGHGGMSTTFPTNAGGEEARAPFARESGTRRDVLQARTPTDFDPIETPADEIATLLSDRFIERRDVKAWQHRDGGYLPDRTRVTMADLRAHLVCKRTMGHYLISREDKCRVLIFDIDLAKTGVWDGEQFEPRKEFADPNSP